MNSKIGIKKRPFFIRLISISRRRHPPFLISHNAIVRLLGVVQYPPLQRRDKPEIHPETRTAQGFRPDHDVQQTDPTADESGLREGVRQKTGSE